MTKQKLREQVITIATLNIKELDEKEKQISMSMLDSKTKNTLFKAIHLSRIHDTQYEAISPLVVNSEIEEIV